MKDASPRSKAWKNLFLRSSGFLSLKRIAQSAGVSVQGDEAREHDGQGDRHGKLAVELACDAAEEGDGDEDGSEHEHDGDECARDLLHGLLGAS